VALGVLHETVYVLDHNGVLKHKFVVRNWLVDTHLLVYGVPFYGQQKVDIIEFQWPWSQIFSSGFDNVYVQYVLWGLFPAHSYCYSVTNCMYTLSYSNNIPLKSTRFHLMRMDCSWPVVQMMEWWVHSRTMGGKMLSFDVRIYIHT